jgi:hypothetical protein
MVRSRAPGIAGTDAMPASGAAKDRTIMWDPMPTPPLSVVGGTASGEDAQAHAPMRGFGVELWVMREGKVAVWEAAFNVGRADADVGIEATLR